MRGRAAGKREKALADPGHGSRHAVSVNTGRDYTGFGRAEGEVEVQRTGTKTRGDGDTVFLAVEKRKPRKALRRGRHNAFLHIQVL